MSIEEDLEIKRLRLEIEKLKAETRLIEASTRQAASAPAKQYIIPTCLLLRPDGSLSWIRVGSLSLVWSVMVFMLLVAVFGL